MLEELRDNVLTYLSDQLPSRCLLLLLFLVRWVLAFRCLLGHVLEGVVRVIEAAVTQRAGTVKKLT